MTPTQTARGAKAVTIDLPWPHRALHPNSRVHWAVKAKHTKKARTDAAWLAKAAGAGKLSAGALDVTATFLPPDARRRDTDGMVSSAKAIFDGLADATGIDDSQFNLSIRRGDIVRNGLVRLEISPARAV